MNTAFVVVVLALLWCGTTGDFSGLNLLFGGLLGGTALWLLRASLAGQNGLRKVRRILSLVLVFLYELLVSALRVAALVVRPDMKRVLRPAIVAVPLSVRSDAEITLLANMITLTPGTISVDVSPDRSVLYVHALTLADRDSMIAEIKNGFEKKVAEVFE